VHPPPFPTTVGVTPAHEQALRYRGWPEQAVAYSGTTDGLIVTQLNETERLVWCRIVGGEEKEGGRGLTL
jgi:hypothetical protein